MLPSPTPSLVDVDDSSDGTSAGVRLRWRDHPLTDSDERELRALLAVAPGCDGQVDSLIARAKAISFGFTTRGSAFVRELAPTPVPRPPARLPTHTHSATVPAARATETAAMERTVIAQMKKSGQLRGLLSNGYELFNELKFLERSDVQKLKNDPCKMIVYCHVTGEWKDYAFKDHRQTERAMAFCDEQMVSMRKKGVPDTDEEMIRLRTQKNAIQDLHGKVAKKKEFKSLGAKRSADTFHDDESPEAAASRSKPKKSESNHAKMIMYQSEWPGATSSQAMIKMIKEGCSAPTVFASPEDAALSKGTVFIPFRISENEGNLKFLPQMLKAQTENTVVIIRP